MQAQPDMDRNVSTNLNKPPAAAASSAESIDEHIQILRDKIGFSRVTTKIPKDLATSLIAFIWDPKYLNVERQYNRRLLNELNILFKNGTNPCRRDSNGLEALEGDQQCRQEEFPSDIDDMLEFKPTEIITDKCTQVLIQFCLGQFDSCYKEMSTLKWMLGKRCVQLQNDNYVGFKFIARMLECFINFVTGEEDLQIFAANECPTKPDEQLNNNELDFQSVPTKSRIVVTIAKCLFSRHFHHNITDRLNVLEAVEAEDSSNYELFLARSEMSRKKRRESKMYSGKKYTAIVEELKIIAEAYILAPENPYVLLCILDCLIDCLRDNIGKFVCGSLTFENSDEMVEYLRATSRKLLELFPNSVKIHSQVSDSFCRLVPYRYFDIPFAEICLQRAYKLNPTNPKTTHRLGIFTRMSKGDIMTSYEWFKKTVELDPIHYNATMECIKNKLAHPREEQIINYIENLITKPVYDSDSESVISCWAEIEILELLFYEGLAYFSIGEKEKALEVWKILNEKNNTFFRLEDLDMTCGHYNYDEKVISTDKLREWIFHEKEKLKTSQKFARDEGDVREEEKEHEELIERLYSIMIGGGYPTRPCRNSGPFMPSLTYQLLKSKSMKAGGDTS